jgi:hypothetical protein
MSGSDRTRSRNALRDRRPVSTGESVTTLAERGPVSKSASSPNTSPRPSRAIVRPRRTTRAVPSIRTNIDPPPRTPSPRTVRPGPYRRTLILPARERSWRFDMPENKGTEATISSADRSSEADRRPVDALSLTAEPYPEVGGCATYLSARYREQTNLRASYTKGRQRREAPNGIFAHSVIGRPLPASKWEATPEATNSATRSRGSFTTSSSFTTIA